MSLLLIANNGKSNFCAQNKKHAIIAASKSMKNRILQKLNQFIVQEPSPEKLILSFCVGNFVAFSPYPFPFGHTGLALLLSLAFGLNTSIVFFAAFLINNPWTAILVYGTDYMFGFWLVHYLLGLEPANPAWMNFINNFLQQKVNCGNFCLWSFLIGGNLLGIITSVMLYPILKYSIARLNMQTEKIHESSCTK